MKYMRSYSESKNAEVPGFDSNLDLAELEEAIIKSTDVTVAIKGITKTGDSVEIEFETGLSSTEQTALNNLITNHTPSGVPKSLNTITYSIKRDIITTSEYSTRDRLVFNGGKYAKICAVSYMDPGTTSYSIRIVDITNNIVIVENTLSNTGESLQVVGTGSNISADKAVWEIQAKRTSTGKSKEAHIDSIHIDYA